MQAAVYVFLGDRYYEAKVGFDQIFFGTLGFLLAVADHGDGVLEFFD